MLIVDPLFCRTRIDLKRLLEVFLEIAEAQPGYLPEMVLMPKRSVANFRK